MNDGHLLRRLWFGFFFLFTTISIYKQGRVSDDPQKASEFSLTLMLFLSTYRLQSPISNSNLCHFHT
ncbi:hypothetical protein VNO78_18077 [Psophocarpus tetragonolobus]|uniref:Uncharacterized protein n=1 Tax=Psophocarpus tetragonolobus TaxID=3891 RepID=A0AAN9XLN8_PSOTE